MTFCIVDMNVMSQKPGTESQANKSFENFFFLFLLYKFTSFIRRSRDIQWKIT